jgi:DNA-binding response OmpR family regulator
LGNEWKTNGAQSLLVKPVNTGELLRQLEALLITHQDQKMAQTSDKKPAIPNAAKSERQAAGKRAH